MTKILKNITASPITISDVGVTIAANSQITIAPQDYLLYAASSNVVTYIGAGTVVVNDGSADLSINQGTSLIQGNFPSSILSRTQDGTGTGVTSTLVSGKQSLDTNVTASALPAGAATSANQTTANASLSSVDAKTPALGQALAAGSVPVVLTAAQLSTLTPLSTVASTQSGAWNITNISGTVSLPTGASTAANQATANASLSSIDTKTPALGQALAASSVPVVLTASQLSTLTPLTTVASTQSGTWNLANISGTISLPTGAATSANQTTANSSLSSIDTKTPALGQALAASSVPVVLTAAQLSTLTPLTTVAVTQSTSPWVTSRNWTLGSGTDSVASVQSGTWNITNISGTISLPTGAATETTLAAASAKLPASLGAKTGATSLSVVPNTDTPFPVSQSGTWNITNISGTVSLPTGASTAASQTTGNTSLSSIDGKLTASNTSLASIDGKITTVNTSAVVISSSALPAGAATSANQTSVTGPVSGGTAATNSVLTGGVFNTTPPMLLSGQQVATQVDSRGRVIISQNFDGPSTDAQNRLRVSLPDTLGAYTFANSLHTAAFNDVLATGGTVTSNTTTASARLATSLLSGSSAIRQSKRYYRYSPGISHKLGVSANIGAKKANVRQRWGYFDANDGLFFQQDSTNLAIVVRTSTSGSVVDTAVNQSAWNLDKLDGTGPSGLTLDTTKVNLYVIDFAWHGSARVRFGVFLKGILLYCHEFEGANTFSGPYIRTPYLPIRVELVNTAATLSTTTLDWAACSFIREASDPIFAPYNFSKSNLRTGVTVSTVVIPVMSIRPKATFTSITNRVPIQVINAQVLAGNQHTLVQVIAGGTLTGAAFTSVNSLSAVEADTAALTITGGIVLAEFYVSSGSAGWFDLSALNDLALLGLDVAGTVQDTLTIAAVSTAGNTTTFATLQWQEFQ